MKFYTFMELVRFGYFHSYGEIKKFTSETMESFLHTMPFVFVPHKEHGIDVGEENIENPIDLPFQRCFFEMLGETITSVQEKNEIINVYGLWVNEISPRNYEVYGMIGFLPTEASIVLAEGPLKEHFLKIIKHLIGRIGREEVGFSNPRKAMKMKIGGIKVKHRINQVVFVSPKKSISSASEALGKAVNWSHRWLVRGHWREIGYRIGKDREGRPILGHTWVASYTKGPDNAPIIEKARIVKGESNE